MSHVSSPLEPCAEIRPLLEVYHDGEVTDAAIKTAIEAHLRQCEGCREELSTVEVLDDQLQSLPVLEGSEAFKKGIRNVERELGMPAAGMRGSRRPRWMVARGVVAATVVLAAVGWWWSSRNENVARRAEAHDELLVFIEDHVAYVQSDAAPVWETNDPLEMERWFGAQLEFRPELPRWPWAQLVSGRLCFIQGQRVARVHYRGADADLTLFIQRDKADTGTPVHSSLMERTLRGYTVGCWKARGLDYVLVVPSSASGEVFGKLGEQG